ncbi:hypothetical protein BN130_1642 [Cronobacter malonaticus 507]|nr:hypothetical protein BN130_1642 [Cronobacter malonaticus 507]
MISPALAISGAVPASNAAARISDLNILISFTIGAVVACCSNITDL